MTATSSIDFLTRAVDTIFWLDSYKQELEVLGQVWVKPTFTNGTVGGTVFEWCHGPKKLTIYHEGADVSALLSWGPDMAAEMRDVALDTPPDRLAAWTWLYNEAPAASDSERRGARERG